MLYCKSCRTKPKSQALKKVLKNLKKSVDKKEKVWYANKTHAKSVRRSLKIKQYDGPWNSYWEFKVQTKYKQGNNEQVASEEASELSQNKT